MLKGKLRHALKDFPNIKAGAHGLPRETPESQY